MVFCTHFYLPILLHACKKIVFVDGAGGAAGKVSALLPSFARAGGAVGQPARPHSPPRASTSGMQPSNSAHISGIALDIEQGGEARALAPGGSLKLELAESLGHEQLHETGSQGVAGSYGSGDSSAGAYVPQGY